MKNEAIDDFFYNHNDKYKKYYITNSLENFLIDVEGITFNFRHHIHDTKDKEPGMSLILTNPENLQKIVDIENKSEFFNKVYRSIIKEVKKDKWDFDDETRRKKF